MKVLLVEDDRETREALSDLLTQEGIQVLAAASGREAREVARAHDFDALLTDLGLPDVAGDVLIGQILAEVSPRPLVVVLTGAGEADQRRARAAGADRLLVKPVEWSSLLHDLQA